MKNLKTKLKQFISFGNTAIILATALYFRFFTSQQILADILFVAVVIISGKTKPCPKTIGYCSYPEITNTATNKISAKIC